MLEQTNDISMENMEEVTATKELSQETDSGNVAEYLQPLLQMGVGMRAGPQAKRSTVIFDYDDDVQQKNQQEESNRFDVDLQEEDSNPTCDFPIIHLNSGFDSSKGPERDPSQTLPQYPTSMVPVEIVWEQGGSKVYVTGSFTGWRKMIGLVADPTQPNLFRIKLHLSPGTHRFRFIVDNELRFSDHLPTATDQMGNFVNYLEIAMTRQPADPVAIDQSKLQQQQNNGFPNLSQMAKDQFLQKVQDHSNPDFTPVFQESHSDSSQVGSSLATHERPGMSGRSKLALKIREEAECMEDGYSRFHEEVKDKPKYEFIQDIPAVFIDPSVMGQYYLTLDQQQNNHQNLSWLTPPQLPPHLEHFILNMYNKSHSSGNENTSGALPIPNHVVLNHLATSSIKHNTLCVASTVRYKRKYATQVLYAPLQ